LSDLLSDLFLIQKKFKMKNFDWDYFEFLVNFIQMPVDMAVDLVEQNMILFSAERSQYIQNKKF